MNKSDTPIPPALDEILDKLQLEATKNGYPPRIILNMRYHPEMLDIIVRIIDAELKCIKKERKNTTLQKQR